MQPNSNYKVARTKTSTLSTSQELWIISQKSNSNCFTWILCVQNELCIRAKLPSSEKALFEKFLFENLDVFAWSPTDMPAIDPAIICHRLAVNPEVKPVK